MVCVPAVRPLHRATDLAVQRASLLVGVVVVVHNTCNSEIDETGFPAAAVVFCLGPCSLEQHCGDYFAPIAQLMGLRHSSWPAQQAVVDAAATTAENATATTTEMFVDHLHAALRMVLQA